MKMLFPHIKAKNNEVMFLVPNSIQLCLYDLSARSMKYDFFFYTGIGYIIFTAFFLFIYEYISVPYRSKDFAFAEFCYDCQFFASQDTRVQKPIERHFIVILRVIAPSRVCIYDKVI